METTLKDALDGVGVDTSTLSVLWGSDLERIYTLTVPGAEAIARWRTLRALVPQTGHWPVLLGDALDLKYHGEALERSGPRGGAKALQRAGALSAARLLQGWASEAEADEDSDADEDPDATQGGWPEDEQPANDFYIPTDYQTNAPKPEIMLGLVPTTRGWEVPALLGFGDWNSCPLPEEHMCLIKHWHEAFGAEIVRITHDVIEMKVARPPQTRDAALALAFEQYAYCPDIVDQGVGEVESLAATLLNGTVWFFWWD